MSKYVFVKINDDITSIKRLKEMFPKIEEEDFETVLKSDPTYNNSTTESGKYGRWLLSLFNKNNLKKEDLYKAKEYLEKFDKKKAKFSNKDINAYKNLPDLYKAIEETEAKEPTKSELKRNVQRTDLDKEAELFMETENFKIYIPLTYEASCKLGANTEWCTATRSSKKYYDMYTINDEKLYIFINKKDPSEKYQWNTLEKYTCDRKDETINEFNLCLKYPDLIKFFDKFGYTIEKAMQIAKEYKEGKEFIYNGRRVTVDVAPYIQKVKISNDITKIESSAFDSCSSLTSIEIPDGVTYIGSCAFARCKSLTNVKIPNSVEIIGHGAFLRCSSLTSIKMPDGVSCIDSSTFAYCESLTNIEIPESVWWIGYSAFEGCSSLRSIKLPNGLEDIGYNAFMNCSSLTSIEIPNSVTNIGDRAFWNCKALKNIKIPNSVTSIGDSAFYNCSSLTSIELSNSLKGIGARTFNGCGSLKSVAIPNSVKYIHPTAFETCNPKVVIKTKNPYVIDFCKNNDLKYFEE